MRPLIWVFALAVFLGALVGASAGVVVFGADAGPSLDAPAPEGTVPAVSNGSVYEGNLTGLYEATADSMVTLRVETPTGSSQGSGFLSEGTYIVTNHHVVADATDVSVQFSDGVWRSATVVGTDVYTDLAVVRTESLPESATPLPVADRMPRPGQFVAAFGSPFGLQGTITHGIVSGVNRSMEVGDGFSIPDTVQTDAPINPGNSGGPLVSMDGTVVGVNRAKSGDNVGFAISARVLERVVPDLIAHGEVEHSFMGIRSIPVTPNVADANQVPEASGIAVVEVLPDGPSDGVLEAGTWADGTVPDDADVIVGIDGTPVRSHEDLTRYLLLHTRPGETVTLSIYRDGRRIQVELELGERPPPNDIP
ncbi:MAG: trypsin-like peptidase domain-containing protein [Halodesulfurarchaeum sp.]|nr:trypsin-like peptidase domain-containing protein [Halodesulfurarchaeum sp.]